MVVHAPVVGMVLDVVMHAHAPAAMAADEQAGQQRAALPRWTRCVWTRLILLQPFLILEVLLPRDVRWQVISNQHLPLFGRNPFAFWLLAASMAVFAFLWLTPVRIGAGIDRMMQRLGKRCQRRTMPFQLSSTRSIAW